MEIADRRRDAERAFLELIEQADMQPPDEVEHDEDEVVFLWHEAKLAVVVDCSEAAAEVPLDARVPGGWGQA